jgi:peptidoglycan/LPS O-acetylase OafA/YrhL
VTEKIDTRLPFPRIKALDGIRTLAVAAVFVYHCEAGWLPGGFLGVDMFFVLSGFLITSLLLSECRRSGGIDLIAFWMRRARRLLPAVVLLIAAVVLAAGIAGLPQLSALRGNAISGLFYFANWHQIYTHVSYFQSFGRPPLLRHLWSLSVEEQFYLFWPPILLFAYRRGGERRVLQVAIVLAVLSAIDLIVLSGFSSVTRIYEGTDSRATTLLVGAIAAMWWSPQKMRALARRVPAVAVDGVGLLCVGLLFYLMTSITDNTTGGLWPGLLATSVLAIGFILSATDSRGILNYLLSRRPMVWLGERSYGIYLWHWPVIVMTKDPNSAYGESLQLALLQAVITIALAAASYAAIERPIRHLGLRGYWEMLRLKASTLFTDADSPDRDSTDPSGAATVLGLAQRVMPIVAAGFAALVLIAGLGSGIFAHGSSSKAGFSNQPSQAQITASLNSTKHDKDPHKSGRGNGKHPGAPHHHDGSTKHETNAELLARYVPEPTMVFGDSVVLGTEPSLTAALGPDTTFNAQVGRQPNITIDAIADTVQAGELPKRVVASLGDNGLLTTAMLRYMKSVIPPGDQVVIVTPRVPDPWGPESAQVIRDARKWWPAMKVADWAALAGNENGWFNDGVHPDDTGILQYVKLIKETLAKFPQPAPPPPKHKPAHRPPSGHAATAATSNS